MEGGFILLAGVALEPPKYSETLLFPALFVRFRYKARVKESRAS